MVIPVKRLARAKTRLRGAVPGVSHDDLVLGFATDTVVAAISCPKVTGVVVVTDEPAVRDAVSKLGARPVSDVPDAGLNPALTYGAACAAEQWPGTALAALGADLPALRPTELAAALTAAESHPRAYVADAEGTGTVLLAAAPEVPLAPRFGPDSARAHRESGAVELRGDWPSLRRDVDTAADLAEASLLGLGPHTARVTGVQATVATFDPESRSGTALLDDGTEVSFDAAAFDASGLRLLRLGQRITLERDADGRVIRVRIPTMS